MFRILGRGVDIKGELATMDPGGNILIFNLVAGIQIEVRDIPQNLLEHIRKAGLNAVKRSTVNLDRGILQMDLTQPNKATNKPSNQGFRSALV